MSKLCVSPFGIQAMLLQSIDRQIALGKDGYICIKANSVTEREVIDNWWRLPAPVWKYSSSSAASAAFCRAFPAIRKMSMSPALWGVFWSTGESTNSGAVQQCRRFLIAVSIAVSSKLAFAERAAA